jgi:hypothetical protein
MKVLIPPDERLVFLIFVVSVILALAAMAFSISFYWDKEPFPMIVASRVSATLTAMPTMTPVPTQTLRPYPTARPRFTRTPREMTFD